MRITEVYTSKLCTLLRVPLKHTHARLRQSRDRRGLRVRRRSPRRACLSLKPLLLRRVRVVRRLGDVAQEHAFEGAQDVRPPVAHGLELARAGLLAWSG